MPTVTSTRPPVSVETPRREGRTTATGEIPGRLVLVLAAAWAVGLGWLFAITPPADPNAVPSAFDAVVQSTMLLSWMGVIAGLASRQRWGVIASGFGAVVLLGAGLLCLATGHSGLWVALQIGVGAGLVGLSGAAWRLVSA